MYVIGLHMETCFKFYIGSIFRIVSLLDPFFGVFLWISLLSIYKMFLVNFNNRVVLGFVDLAMCINIYIEIQFVYLIYDSAVQLY